MERQLAIARPGQVRTVIGGWGWGCNISFRRSKHVVVVLLGMLFNPSDNKPCLNPLFKTKRV